MGAQFRADIHLPPGTAAGSFPLFNPGGKPVIVTHVAFATDTAQRFVVGLGDTDGQRIFAAPKSLGGIRDLHLDTGQTGLVGPIVVITTADSEFDAMIEGCSLE